MGRKIVVGNDFPVNNTDAVDVVDIGGYKVVEAPEGTYIQGITRLELGKYATISVNVGKKKDFKNGNNNIHDVFKLDKSLLYIAVSYGSAVYVFSTLDQATRMMQFLTFVNLNILGTVVDGE